MGRWSSGSSPRRWIDSGSSRRWGDVNSPRRWVDSPSARRWVSAQDSVKTPMFSVEHDSAIANLNTAGDWSLTINGQTVAPMLVYEGKNATVSGWTATSGGGTLGIIGSGADVVPGQNLPLTESTDKGVLFQAAKTFQAANGAVGDVGSEDVVLHAILQAPQTVSSQFIISKYDNPDDGWVPLYSDSGERFVSYIKGEAAGLPTIRPVTGTLTPGAWYDVWLFYDVSSRKAVLYCNGIAGSEATAASVTTLTTAKKLNIGSFGDGTTLLRYDGEIAFIGMWKKDDWLDTHMQTALVQEYFARLNGTYPQIATGTAVPTCTRNCVAYVDKTSDLGVTSLHPVGAHWPLVARRGGKAVYVGEEARTNLLPYSKAFDSWTARGSVVVTANTVIAPDGTLTADTVSGIDHVSGPLNDIYSYYSTGTPEAPYEPSFWIKRISTSGVLRLSNPYAYNGRWDVDLSLLGGEWERIVRGHPAVTVDGGYPDFANASGGVGYGGIDFCAQSGGPLSAYLWGAVCEEAAFKTGTIYGDGESVRVASVLRYAGGGNVRDGTGPRTYVTRFMVDPGRSGYLWSISDGGASTDRIYLTIEPTTGVARVRTAISTGDAGNVTGTTDLTDGAEHEVRVLLCHNSLRLIVDGVEEGTRDTAVDIPQGLDRWDVGCDQAQANHLNGAIVSLKCYRGLVLR